jgi:hypothetical protein
MKRVWAISTTTSLGNPVLVERCATREDAMRFVEHRGLRSCGSLFVVEQILPLTRLLPVGREPAHGAGESEASEQPGHDSTADGTTTRA